MSDTQATFLIVLSIYQLSTKPMYTRNMSQYAPVIG